ARPRLSLACGEGPAGARPHRDFQSLLLRRSARRPDSPIAAGRAEASAIARQRQDLAGTVRGYQRLRAAPVAERDRRPEVLPARIEAGAGAPTARTARQPAQELEIFNDGPGRASAV